MSNFFVQELVLYRHFMLIDSPIPFELVANPTNLQKDAQGNIINPDKSLITGRDICSRPAGAWRVDCWTLLPEKYHKLNPVFTMLIKYDMDLLAEGEKVDIRYSDIDVGEGVAGVNGQLVNIRAEDLRPVVLGMEAQGELTREKLDSLNSTMASVQTAQNASNTLFEAQGELTREKLDSLNSTMASVQTAQNASNTILNDVKNSNDASILLLDDIKNAVLEVDNGSINNKVEQIRTILKSPISSPSPYDDLRTSIGNLGSLISSLFRLSKFNRFNDYGSFFSFFRGISGLVVGNFRINNNIFSGIFSVDDDLLIGSDSGIGFILSNSGNVTIYNGSASVERVTGFNSCCRFIMG